jgi:very-short-patch-repair endonuclease
MYPKNVAEYIDGIHIRLDRALCDVVKGCESPIEQLFALGCYEIERDDPRLLVLNFQLIPQVEIQTNKKKYRIDFMLRLEDWTNEHFPGVATELIVECDGHNYHSSKEQIARDNKRDRALNRIGFEVMHFSGSEINSEPYECAREATERLIQKAAQKDRELRRTIDE